MSPLDQQLITRKIKLIEEDLTRLKPYREMSEDQYLANEDAQLKVERLLERIIGRLIDVNYHILKQEHGVLPKDYFESFVLIGQKNVVSQTLSQELAKAAGFRNVLAHQYDEIDQRKVYGAISSVLTQVPIYLQSILRTLS